MEAIPDAYTEYIEKRREAAKTERIGTLSLPVSQLQAIFLMISDSLADYAEDKGKLPEGAQRIWDSITRELSRAIREAE